MLSNTGPHTSLTAYKCSLFTLRFHGLQIFPENCVSLNKSCINWQRKYSKLPLIFTYSHHHYHHHHHHYIQRYQYSKLTSHSNIHQVVPTSAPRLKTLKPHPSSAYWNMEHVLKRRLITIYFLRDQIWMIKFYDWNPLIIPLYITARASMALDISNKNLIDLNRRFHGGTLF